MTERDNYELYTGKRLVGDGAGRGGRFGVPRTSGDAAGRCVSFGRRNNAGSKRFKSTLAAILLAAFVLAALPGAALMALTEDEYSDRQYVLDQLGFPHAWEQNLNGSKVTAAIIDSGLIPEHEDIDPTNLLPGKNYTKTGSAASTTDRLGHGTYVTGLLLAKHNNQVGIAGLTPAATILPLKCFDVNTQTDVLILTQALQDAIASDSSVINMSFGFGYGNSAEQDTGGFEAALGSAAAKNIIMVAPVGSDKHNEPLLPAAHHSVIGVGAVDANSQAAPYSQIDTSVFITAPGENIISLWHTGPGDYKTNETGTSYAAVFVTALAIMAKDFSSDITIDQFKILLASTAKDLGDPGYDPIFGFGLIDAAKFTDELIRTNGGQQDLLMDIAEIETAITSCDLTSYLPEPRTDTEVSSDDVSGDDMSGDDMSGDDMSGDVISESDTEVSSDDVSGDDMSDTVESESATTSDISEISTKVDITTKDDFSATTSSTDDAKAITVIIIAIMLTAAAVGIATVAFHKSR